MQTWVKINGKKEEEIITNYDLFVELVEDVFSRLAESKILGPIKLEMLKIDEEILIKNKHQKKIINIINYR